MDDGSFWKLNDKLLAFLTNISPDVDVEFMGQ